MICLELFATFFRIGLFTIGGGYAMLPLIQQEVQIRGWMTAEALVNFVAVSESTPGPFAVNISTYVGAELAGLPTVPCIIRELTDDEAIIVMVDSNLQREQILPSEKAVAYKMKLEAMKRQGMRTDLTFGPLGQKSAINTRDTLATEVPDSSRQIQRYIRLTNLIPELLDMVDNSVLKEAGKLQMALRPAVELSYLPEAEQTALLEVMEEGSVTIDGVTRVLPKPFLVIATQNPIGSVGTQMLPESQLDRFMIKLNMGYPDLQSEVDILKARHSENPIDHVHQVASAEDIVRLQRQTEQIYVDDRIYNYIASLAQATRQHQMLRLGISPRGTLALTAAAKATALLRGRDYVTSDDVRFMLRDVFAHRLLLSAKARMQEITVEQVIGDVVRQVPVPVIGDEI